MQLGLSVLAFRDLGRDQELQAVVVEVLDLFGDDPNAAAVYAAIGDLDTAFEILMVTIDDDSYRRLTISGSPYANRHP